MFPIYQRVTCCLGLSIVVFLSGCGGSASSITSIPNSTTAVSVINSAPILVCPNGGITFHSGIDTNNNQILDEAEIIRTQYVCNGANGVNGSNGTNGVNGIEGVGSIDALMSLVSEAAGINCLAGGSKVNVGLDLNRNQILDASEILSFTFICNGVTSADGTAGATGPTGPTGVAGTAGANGAVGSNGAAGANGVVGATGPIGAAGTAGATGATGATGAAGANGLTTLLILTSEIAGDNCMSGGAKTTSGPDTNSNQKLDDSEIVFTKYICNGATGAVGATGVAGPSGASGAKGDTGATGATGGSIQAFAYIFNTAGQTVALEQPILFDSNGLLQGIEHSLLSGDIKVLNGGTYLISYAISGTQSNQFAIFVNGVVAVGSIYGTGAGTQPNYGQVILQLAANDLVSVVNHTSAAAVGLQALAGGTQANVNASIVIQRLI